MVIQGDIRWGVSRSGNSYTLAFDNLTREEVRQFLLTMHSLQRDGQRTAVTVMSAEALSLSQEVIESILKHGVGRCDSDPLPLLGDIDATAPNVYRR